VANSFAYNYTVANKFGITNTGAGTPPLSTGTYGTVNIPYLNSATRNTGNSFSLFTNGTADGTGTPAYSFLTTNLRLGNRAVSADAAFIGGINEVVVYNRALPADELRQVHSYMALKYGITMSGNYMATDGTTAYWDATANTGYNNNIAGIGRDDKTTLYQKQSRSVNTTANGNMVAMALDSLSETNKDNSATVEASWYGVMMDLPVPN
jgi:hypothetical protein